VLALAIVEDDAVAVGEIVIEEFVQFLVSGPVVPCTVTRPIRERDVKLAVEMAKDVRSGYPAARAFAFEFITAPAKRSGQPDDGQPDLSREVKPRSGLYFLGGRLEEREYGVVRMHTDGLTTITLFREKDCVVDADGTIIEHGDDPRYVACRKRALEFLAGGSR
jgi:hypothetical protein